MTDFFKDKEIGENYEITTGKDIITLKPIDSKVIIPSKTHLNFSQCESALRNKFNFNSSILTLFQLEISNKNPKSLINQVEYGIFDENFTKIELSKCKDLNVEVIYGMKKGINSINYTDVIYYQNSGINIFNLSDPFFNDICHAYPDYEDDIILEDRIKDIFLNYSVCEEGCTYKEFDNNYYTFTCQCKIKNSINEEINENNFEESQIRTNNLEILKCANLVFTSEDKINNIGFWIFTFALGGHVPLFFHFINTGIKPIEEFIFNEMSEYGELILKKIENLYKKTNQFTKKNVIEDVNTHCHYWSDSLNPIVKKVFCRSPWPKSQFRIGILGKYGIGKTALFRWFYEGRYCRFYENTIGGAFTLYQVEINNKNFIIGFDDTGGQEKFGADCCRSFIKNNNYAILVFDITERKSFDEIKKRYYPFIQGSENLKNNCVLVGNKLDLNYERKVSYEEAEFFADEKKMKYFEVSVKSGLNMQRLFNYIHYYLSKNIA